MKETGFKIIRLSFILERDTTEEQILTPAKLTEGYCVVYQVLTSGFTFKTDNND